MEQGSIIAIGNPGIGKSAILNALASRVLFRSGFSVERGLTYNLDQKVVGMTTFCDTPGLADAKQKQEAGAAIRESLNMGGPHKILFFCKLDDGRVNMADCTTMKLVHEAAQEIGHSYGIIVNKVAKKAYKRMSVLTNLFKIFCS